MTLEDALLWARGKKMTSPPNPGEFKGPLYLLVGFGIVALIALAIFLSWPFLVLRSMFH